ncbi:MAG: WYL domain-containing protein [Clostridia bacterium]|nr:WYL domain-containing protein [Clostridia bacterium]
MSYSELIKNFERIRDYMRQFYVYGFKSRNDYDAKSARSYDNERRRIESWLGEYMQFRQDNDGKRVFLSVDSRSAAENPLYKAFKAKSFTNNDIAFHFYILDTLADGERCTVADLMKRFTDYFDSLDEPFVLDESTVRKKLKEYTKLGLLKTQKYGRELLYSLPEKTDIQPLENAVAFFSEDSPLGVIGSFILDKFDEKPDIFRFKHHYILHALDSDILCDILIARQEKRNVEIGQNDMCFTLYPVKIYISTQTGRHYLLGYDHRHKRLGFFRLDTIVSVKILESEPDYEEYEALYSDFASKLWGVSNFGREKTEHVEMTIHIADNEGYIIDRLNREKRNGKVEKIDDNTYKYSADVFDSIEMLPWIRTFTGRIIELKSDNEQLVQRFYSDVDEMIKMYGGDADAV